MKPNILLIQSVNLKWKEKFKGHSFPPLGLLYIAANLQKHGYNVKVIDFFVEDIDKISFGKLLDTFSPFLVGISTCMESFSQSQELTSSIKLFLPNTKIVLGGAFPSFMFSEILVMEPKIDFIVRNEGEISMIELAKTIFLNKSKDISKINGLIYRENSDIKVNPKREAISNLDFLPFPSRDLVKLDRYALPFSISTARGCPGKCIFCSSRAFWGAKIRMRSAENVLNEIVSLHNDYNTFQFYITDDTFTMNRSRVFKFCQLLKKTKINFLWGCESRVDIITNNLLENMFDAGCKKLQFGIESGNQNILNSLGKKITLEQIENAISIAHKVGYNIIGSFILGHYMDTIETMQETIDFCNYLKNKYECTIAVSVNTPFPGTHQYDNSKHLGLKIHSKIWDDYILCNPIISTDNFSISDLRKIYFKALDTFVL